jgi:integrase
VTLPTDEPGGEPQTAALLFTTRERKPLNRNYFNVFVWRPALVEAHKALVEAEQPGIGEPSRATGCHRLRHTYAGLMLAGGVGVAALAKWLGHADPGFTLRTYGALVPDVEDRSRVAMEAAWVSPVSGERQSSSSAT